MLLRHLGNLDVSFPRRVEPLLLESLMHGLYLIELELRLNTFYFEPHSRLLHHLNVFHLGYVLFLSL